MARNAINMVANDLQIPSRAEKQKIMNAFVKDLESFTLFEKGTNTFHPVICCVCDSIPSQPNWSCYVKVATAMKLFEISNMEISFLQDVYPSKLLEQYSVKHRKLKKFVLSPATYINEKEEVLMCKKCHSELIQNWKSFKHKKKKDFLPPVQAIASRYVIGDAPDELTTLNEVELSLVSRARIFCQSWIFFGGCHQHIKGWHTFFRNRPTDNVGNLLQLIDAGPNNNIILVVLCGPFTKTQKAITMASTAVNPKKVIAAWRWLKANNFRYEKDVIPEIDTIPLPKVICEDK